MKTFQLNIEGMSCHHCAVAVQKELQKLTNVTVEKVIPGKATVQAEESFAQEQFSKAITDAGYKLISVE